MTVKLKQCPCGKIPQLLSIMDIGQGGKWACAIPTCCGEWMIEFKVNYLDFNSIECMALAITEWNKAPRGNNK